MALDASPLGDYGKADCPCCDEVSVCIVETWLDSTVVSDRKVSDKVDCKISTVPGREALVVYLCWSVDQPIIWRETYHVVELLECLTLELLLVDLTQKMVALLQPWSLATR